MGSHQSFKKMGDRIRRIAKNIEGGIKRCYTGMLSNAGSGILAINGHNIVNLVKILEEIKFQRSILLMSYPKRTRYQPARHTTRNSGINLWDKITGEAVKIRRTAGIHKNIGEASVEICRQNERLSDHCSYA
jgi:deoxyxylulose-5-phosphate synthase